MLHIKVAPIPTPLSPGSHSHKEGNTFSLLFSSLTDEELPKTADRSAMSTSAQNVVRVLVRNGEITLSPRPYKQSKLRMAGEVSVGKRLVPSLQSEANGTQRSQFFEGALNTLRGARPNSTTEEKRTKKSGVGMRVTPLASTFLSIDPGIGHQNTSAFSSPTNSNSHTKYGSINEVLKKFKKIPVLLFKLFQNEKKIDEANYSVFIEDIKSLPLLSSLEDKMITDSCKFCTDTEWKNFAGTGKPSHPVLMSRRLVKGDRYPWGRAVATVHASATTLLAYIMCFDSYERVRRWAAASREATNSCFRKRVWNARVGLSAARLASLHIATSKAHS